MSKKLSEIVPEGTEAAPLLTAKADVYDKELEIFGVTFKEGDTGEYAHILFKVVGQSEWRSMLSGSSFVLPKLHAVATAKQYPIFATLKKVGNSDQLV